LPASTLHTISIALQQNTLKPYRPWGRFFVSAVNNPRAIDFSCTDLEGKAAMKTNLYAALVVPADCSRSRIERIVAATTPEA
jgi:hypothetical protein